LSYRAIDQLQSDGVFYGRVRASAQEQSETFKDDQRPDFVAVATNVLRGADDCVGAFVRLAAAGPGIGDKVDNGDGTIDQSKVTDADLLSLTQANWQVVAGLFFTEDGSPIPTP
jgi:hypothetical protein